ncbi:uncharacterized protein CMC5_056110 [Chondromyces crocatus]|uniref:Uncharacterized protein n=1 Tax=Chondromyces crocatus TaxID=52 RepID=A0A0K1EKP9_CHOCO|nr:uncharacterized protein CMC5_056110 [Chondromyces crocatus]
MNERHGGWSPHTCGSLQPLRFAHGRPSTWVDDGWRLVTSARTQNPQASRRLFFMNRFARRFAIVFCSRCAGSGSFAAITSFSSFS